MDLSAISQTAPGAIVASASVSPFLAARKLNSLQIEDRQFSVVRDPQTNRFVVEVVQKSTGTVLDQFPAESMLKLMMQFAADEAKPAIVPPPALTSAAGGTQ